VARIGESAIVTAKDGKIEVTAKTSDTPKSVATSSISFSDEAKDQQDNGDGKTSSSWGGSFIFTMSNNDAEAFIGKSAQVNARKSLLVRSTTEMPYDAISSYLEEIEAFTKAETYESRDLGPGLPVQIPVNFIEAAGKAKEKYASDYFGTKSLFTSWSRTSGESSGKSNQGAADIFILWNKSRAHIDSNAMVNQDTRYRSDAQDVRVEAVNDVAAVNFSGVIPDGEFGNFAEVEIPSIKEDTEAATSPMCRRTSGQTPVSTVRPLPWLRETPPRTSALHRLRQKPERNPSTVPCPWPFSGTTRSQRSTETPSWIPVSRPSPARMPPSWWRRGTTPCWSTRPAARPSGKARQPGRPGP
jgi:hypothetical protein